MHSSCDISALLLLVFHKKNRADVIFLMKFSSTRDLGKVEIFLFQCEMKGGVESLEWRTLRMGKLLRKAMVALATEMACCNGRLGCEKARRASISVANGTERAAEKPYAWVSLCPPH